MFRHVHLFGVLVFILGFTGSAWGQNFSDVVVFGDSLSDSGNGAQGLRLHHQSRPGLVRDRGANLRRVGHELSRRRTELRFRRGLCESGYALRYRRIAASHETAEGDAADRRVLSSRGIEPTRTRFIPSGAA